MVRRSALASLVLLLFLFSAAARAGEVAWKAGDKVEAWSASWYKGVVKAVGSGDHAGTYLIHWDEYSNEEWVEAKNVRARKGAATAAKKGEPAKSGEPAKQGETAKKDNPSKKGAGLQLAMGAYRCGVFLSGRYTPAGGFTLAADGTYKTKAGGSGKYEVDAAKKRIAFPSGPLEDSFGRIVEEPEHDRVIVKLNQKKDAGESESKQNWKSQYCTPVKD